MNYCEKYNKSKVYSKSLKPKIYGINLIGLMISSALGAFIISIIIKLIVNFNNNFQVIQGYLMLERSSRIVYRILNNFFDANGFGSASSSNINTFYIKNNETEINFSMWYANGLPWQIGSSMINNNFISCSGRTLDSNIVSQEITIFIKKYISDADLGYFTCINRLNGLTATDRTNAANAMPLISKSHVASFYVAAIVEDPITDGQIKIMPINYANATNVGLSGVDFRSFGIKLALVLKTPFPVYNVDKTTNFSSILGISSFNFNKTDKFLYKLLVIEVPFINRNLAIDASQNISRILTRIIPN